MPQNSIKRKLPLNLIPFFTLLDVPSGESVVVDGCVYVCLQQEENDMICVWCDIPLGVLESARGAWFLKKA
jgi:hypothetical protein